MVPLVFFFVVRQPHDVRFSVPESQHDTLDFSLEPASLAAVAANEESAGQFRTAGRFNTAEMFPAPSPQDGRLNFSFEPASLAAVATNRVPESSSTASIFNTAVRGSDAAARESFPNPRLLDGTLRFNITSALFAAVAIRADSAET